MGFPKQWCIIVKSELSESGMKVLRMKPKGLLLEWPLKTMAEDFAKQYLSECFVKVIPTADLLTDEGDIYLQDKN